MLLPGARWVLILWTVSARPPTTEEAQRAEARPTLGRLLGFGPAGEITILGADGAFAYDPARMTRTPQRTGSAITAPAWIAPRAPGRYDLGRGLGFELEARPPLGDRGHLEAALTLDGERTIVERRPLGARLELFGVAQSPDGRRLLVDLALGERRGVLSFDLGRARAELLEARALRLLAGDRLAARALLEAAVEEDPGLARLWYNLACVLALLGDQDRASQALLLALDLEPATYRRFSRVDPDLEPLLSRAEVKAALGGRIGER